jgi:small subunit ribosomal protein S4
MGDPKKRRRKYQKPRKAFQKDRILKERETKETFGLKNKREFYIAESWIRGKRTNARQLLALSLDERLRREKELLDSLKRQGILRDNPTLDDVLMLTPEAFLERRLQTIVWRKGLANTAKQARQFIVHGHIEIEGRKVDRPSYLVRTEEEGNIKYHKQELILEVKPMIVDKKEGKEETNTLKSEFEEMKGEEKKEKSDAPKEAAPAEVKEESAKEVVKETA